METASINQSHLHDPATLKDKPRGKSLVKMRVVNRSTTNLNPTQFNTIGPGTHEIHAYEDQTQKVMALVETQPALIKAAEDRYKRTIADKVREKLSGFSGTAEDVVSIVEGKTAHASAKEAKALYEHVAATEPVSVQRAFYELAGREMLPLVSAEVIPDSAQPEPQRQQASTDMKQFVAAVVATLEARSNTKK